MFPKSRDIYEIPVKNLIIHYIIKKSQFITKPTKLLVIFSNLVYIFSLVIFSYFKFCLKINSSRQHSLLNKNPTNTDVFYSVGLSPH